MQDQFQCVSGLGSEVFRTLARVTSSRHIIWMQLPLAGSNFQIQTQTKLAFWPYGQKSLSGSLWLLIWL